MSACHVAAEVNFLAPLIDSSARFAGLNAKARDDGSGEEYKIVYAARHGEGHHSELAMMAAFRVESDS